MDSLPYLYLRNCLRTVKRSMINTIYFNEKTALPIIPRNDDVYLVSYPKSGNTWLEFLMANVNVSMSNKNIKINFYNLHQYMPDIHVSRNLPDPILGFPGFRFIKSHSKYNPFYANIIYISRDPRDVMLSYYYFQTQLGLFKGSLSNFIASKLYGIDSWAAHVDGWFNKSSASTGLITIRYEDLKKDTEGTLSEIYNQLGLIVPKNIIQKAIESSSFENMQKLEENYRYGGREIGNSFKFMRNGVTGQGKVYINAKDLCYISERAGSQMKILRYL